MEAEGTGCPELPQNGLRSLAEKLRTFPSPPLPPKSPEPLLKKPPTTPRCCDKNPLTHNFPFDMFTPPKSDFLSNELQSENEIFNRHLGI
jgi:hypothetical protein